MARRTFTPELIGGDGAHGSVIQYGSARFLSRCTLAAVAFVP